MSGVPVSGQKRGGKPGADGDRGHGCGRGQRGHRPGQGGPGPHARAPHWPRWRVRNALRADGLRVGTERVAQPVFQVAHGSSLSSRAIAARARDAVDDTVPRLTPRVAAIS